MTSHWHVTGQYLESCNCEAICPCRMSAGLPGGRSTYGECLGLLTWRVDDGAFEGIDLSGLNVALACRYHDDEPGSPWTIVFYVDADGDRQQRAALEAIYLGRAGGERILRLPWVRKPSFVLDVRPAEIEFDGEQVRVGERTRVRATRPVEEQDDVRCGIPGYEETGVELYADVLAVHDDPFDYELTGNCAYRSEFRYSS
ncbi:MAG: DUF1326 domain-containing protein [Gaiellaceae bacterium]